MKDDDYFKSARRMTTGMLVVIGLAIAVNLAAIVVVVMEIVRGGN